MARSGVASVEGAQSVARERAAHHPKAAPAPAHGTIFPFEHLVFGTAAQRLSSLTWSKRVDLRNPRDSVPRVREYRTPFKKIRVLQFTRQWSNTFIERLRALTRESRSIDSLLRSLPAGRSSAVTGATRSWSTTLGAGDAQLADANQPNSVRLQTRSFGNDSFVIRLDWDAWFGEEQSPETCCDPWRCRTFRWRVKSRCHYRSSGVPDQRQYFVNTLGAR